MRSDIMDLDPPFHWDVNPGAEAAHQRSIGWLRQFGVLADDGAAARHWAERWGLWGGVSWPMASAERLQLGVDLPSLWSVLDTELSSTDQELLGALRGAIERPDEPATGVPTVAALADLWSRQRLVASAVSETLAERSARRWLEWLDACAVEADSQQAGGPQTRCLEAYSALRDVSGVMQVIYTFDEAIGGYEVPDQHLALGTPLGEMRQAATRYIDYLNDLASLPKEEADGETLNGILVLQRQRRCGRAEAMAEVRRMVRAYTDRFLIKEASLPAYCDAHGLDLAQRRWMYRAAAGMRNLMSAVYMISVYSGRWATAPQDEPAQAQTPPKHDGAAPAGPCQ